jgi:hypothetical protein
MESNVSKYQDDFNKLQEFGNNLHMAIQYECNPEEVTKLLKENYKDQKKVNKYIKDLPIFKTDYQKWYSECKSLIKQGGFKNQVQQVFQSI